MKYSHILFLLAFWLFLCAPSLRADTTFYSGRSEYILVTTPRTWDAAQADAVAKGGNLARMDSVEENTQILSKISGKVTTTASDGGGAVYVWIGGKETATEGSFAWASGNTTFWSGGKTGAAEGSLYSNWGLTPQDAAGPEPDNFAGTQNRAGLALGRWPSSATSDALAIGTAGQWNDLNGTNLLPYVIERPITKPSEGIFATFTMTHGGRPIGSFTCQLFYQTAPVTVAHFTGLAEGTRAFFDEAVGKVATRPYFNGLKIHRIDPDFMIQGGDQRGNGVGGPGYRFLDEFDPELRHDHQGVLSMANNGVNTNGSQFFVTVNDKPNTQLALNDKYSVFGRVVSGYETVVVPISKVATMGTVELPSERPLEDVVIQSVTIERLGADALAFDSSTYNSSPAFSLHPLRFVAESTGKMFVRWSEPPNVSYALANSPDLQTWTGSTFNYVAGNRSLAVQELEVTDVPAAGANRHFFRLHKATYPLLPPPTLTGKRIVLKGTRIGQTITMDFTSATGGTHRTRGASLDLLSTLSNVAWNPSRWESAALTSDINPPVSVATNTGADVLTHSDWNFTYRSVKGVYTGGYFIGALYTENRTVYYTESGTFTITTP